MRARDKLKALRNRHDYLVDSLANKVVSEGVRDFWDCEREALAWAIPLLTDAGPAIAATIKATVEERYRVEMVWRGSFFEAMAVLDRLDPSERERIARRLPEDQHNQLVCNAETRRHGVRVPPADDTRERSYGEVSS